MIPLSFGFSCQTRFAINAGSAATSTMPFDWAITTRSFLTNALETDGRCFEISESEASIYTMPVERTEGIYANGIYFWHDFPRKESAMMIDDWRKHIRKVNDRYRIKWQRLRDIIFDDRLRKNIMLSNSQLNLVEFAADKHEFSQKFGLDTELFHLLYDRLRFMGISNFAITFLVRDFSNYETFIDLHARAPDDFSVRFAGEMSLPVNNKLVSSLFFCVQDHHSELSEIAGCYDNGSEIVIMSTSALVYMNGNIFAEASQFPGGYIFVFKGRDAIFTARFLYNKIYFSNKTVWTKCK